MVDEQRLYDLAQAAQKTALRKRRRSQARTRRRTLLETASPAPASRAERPRLRLSPTQQAGSRGEEQARQHLQASGLVIVSRNLRARTGEIDLVALEGGILVFIEVRQRRSPQYGGAAASVNRDKQLRLIRTAQYFLPRLVQRYCAGRTPACRFDVVSLEAGGLVWIKGAFTQ